MGHDNPLERYRNAGPSQMAYMFHLTRTRLNGLLPNMPVERRRRFLLEGVAAATVLLERDQWGWASFSMHGPDFGPAMVEDQLHLWIEEGFTVLGVTDEQLGAQMGLQPGEVGDMRKEVAVGQGAAAIASSYRRGTVYGIDQRDARISIEASWGTARAIPQDTDPDPEPVASVFEAMDTAQLLRFVDPGPDATHLQLLCAWAAAQVLSIRAISIRDRAIRAGLDADLPEADILAATRMFPEDLARIRDIKFTLDQHRPSATDTNPTLKD